MGKRISKILNIVLVIMLFLQVTDTYKIILLVIGKKTVFFSTLTLVFSIIYLLFNFRDYRKIYKFKIFKKWIWLILFLPLLINTIHLFIGNLSVSEYTYWFSFILFCSLLFVLSAIYFSKHPLKTTNRFFLFSFLSIIISFIIGNFNYNFIRALMSVSEVLDDTAFITSESIRSVGFYTQANIAARALLLFFILISGTYLIKKQKVVTYGSIFIFIFLVLMTGSRTVLILALLFCLFYLPKFIYRNIYLKVNSILITFKKLILSLFLPFFGILILLFFSLVVDFAKNYIDDSVINRFNFITEFSEIQNLEEDKSVNIRGVIINQYLGEISKNLILGNGPSLRNEYIKKRIFANASQNQYLEDAFSYGIFYVMFYIYVIIYTIYKVKLTYIVDNDKFLFLGFLLLLILVYGFSVNYLLINRLFLITIGCFIGLVYSNKIGKRNENNPLHWQVKGGRG